MSALVMRVLFRARVRKRSKTNLRRTVAMSYPKAFNWYEIWRRGCGGGGLSGALCPRIIYIFTLFFPLFLKLRTELI